MNPVCSHFLGKNIGIHFQIFVILQLFVCSTLYVVQVTGCKVHCEEAETVFKKKYSTNLSNQ